MATTKPAPAPSPSKQLAPVGGSSRRVMNFLRGIREGDPVVWKELLEEVKRAQGNLEEVARRVGVSRETLRRWEKRYERLGQAVEKAVEGNVMLSRQRKAWTSERKKAVAERERKHHESLYNLENARWSGRASHSLPPGVAVGKRAVILVTGLERTFEVPVFVIMTTPKRVHVGVRGKEKDRVKRVSPERVKAWPQEGRFRKSDLEWLEGLEKEHRECFFSPKKGVEPSKK